uniref:Uncharacterized protein n=1 Tax=Parascaris equorum TaxID=6256 RepID=A0A914SJ90_PAREQ
MNTSVRRQVIHISQFTITQAFPDNNENHWNRRAAIAEGDNDPVGKNSFEICCPICSFLSHAAQKGREVGKKRHGTVAALIVLSISRADDYLEAEIESTDSLRVAVSELFGVRLLETKFHLCNGDGKSIAVCCEVSTMGRDEITAPPGTVPRRVPQLQKQTSIVPRKSLTPVSRLASLSAESVCIPDRPTSISSQQTFVLENDRRRPLVARNAFQCDVERVRDKQRNLIAQSVGRMRYEKMFVHLRNFYICDTKHSRNDCEDCQYKKVHSAINFTITAEHIFTL